MLKRFFLYLKIEKRFFNIFSLFLRFFIINNISHSADAKNAPLNSSLSLGGKNVDNTRSNGNQTHDSNIWPGRWSNGAKFM